MNRFHAMEQQTLWDNSNTPATLTVMSGGQTGVDRAALDAALSAGAACAGWCPAGRKSEDGVIPGRYPLIELPGADYLARTRKNVQDSDATLIVAFGEPSGGTARTVEFCRRLHKPCLIINAAETGVAEAARRSAEFVTGRGVQRLNVAGPRESRDSRAYDFAFELVGALLRIIGLKPAQIEKASR